MPLSYRIGRALIRLTVKGDLEYSSCLDTLRAAFEEARKSARPPGPGWNVLIDLTESTEQRTTDELRGIAMSMAQQSDMLAGRLALVTADPYLLELARAFSAFVEKLGQEPRLFSDVADADAWLRS